MIFKLYLDYNALVPVVREIHRRGWRTKQWVTRKGVTHGGKPFTKGRLFRLLTNPIYIGKIDFQKQTYEGEHEAIVEVAIWEPCATDPPAEWPQWGRSKFATATELF